jgi:outer membrane protein
MKQLQSFLASPSRAVAILCIGMAAAPGGWAQSPEPGSNPGPRLDSENPHWYSSLTKPYESRTIPPVNVSNTTRLDSLMRAGNLYLSLADAIALAIENNLDVEVQRYEFSFADADLLRAKSGNAIIGIPTSVTSGMPTGATGLLGNLNTGVASSGASTSLVPGITYDPMVTGTVSWGHITTPLSNSVVSGLTDSISTNKTANFGITEGFVTGGYATLSYNNLTQLQNSFTNTYNPATTSSIDLTITQPLLQGFGLAMNNRTIRIARNNLHAADLVFKQQVINVVANVAVLYWNLVYFNNDLDVKRRSVATSIKLLNDNKAQVQVGTLAPIAVVQAEAQVASDQQALVQSETNVLQQETIIKSALSRNGLASQPVASARIIPTDHIQIPEVIETALDKRPELAQSQVQIENSKLNLVGVKNQLLPQLSAVVDLRNSALSGTANALVNPRTGFSIANPAPGVPPSTVPDPFFIGGYGNILGQLFGRNFPNYTVGVQLNIPLRNRAAQANLMTQELNLRQSQLSVQRLINQIRVDVQTALTAVTQARAQYQAAAKARILQEQTADAEVKKLAVGASTPYNVILMQRDMWAAQDAEVQAQATYILAKVQLDWSVGETLERSNVVLDEAKTGHVSKPADALPPLAGGR